MDNITEFLSLLLRWIPTLVFLAGCSLSAPASPTGVPTSEAQELNRTPSTPTFSLTATSTPIDEVPTRVPATATESPDNTTPSGENGAWQTFEFTSQALQQNLIGDSATRTIHIYLPPGYGADDTRYPVMFALHGYIDNPSSMHGMGTQLDALIASGKAQEMIIVAPDGSNLLGGSHYMSSPTIGDYESYISQELVAYVDANYHTITDADSRGISGCSMGANGALHLAFLYPEVFSVAAGVSGGYILEDYPEWEKARSTTLALPKDLRETSFLIWYQKDIYAFAAAVAPNPENAPFYFDLPFEIVNGEAQIVPEVLQKVSDANVINDARSYLDQPTRLRGLAIYHGLSDFVPIELAKSLSEALTVLNIDHDYYEVDGEHCGSTWDYSDLLVYISNHLAHEQ